MLKCCVSLPSHEFGWVHLHVFYLFLCVCMSSPTLPSHLPCPINSLPLSLSSFNLCLHNVAPYRPSAFSEFLPRCSPVILCSLGTFCVFIFHPYRTRSFSWWHSLFLSSHTLLLMLCWYKLLRRASTTSLSFSHLKDCMYENAIR